MKFKFRVEADHMDSQDNIYVIPRSEDDLGDGLLKDNNIMHWVRFEDNDDFFNAILIEILI